MQRITKLNNLLITKKTKTKILGNNSLTRANKSSFLVSALLTLRSLVKCEKSPKGSSQERKLCSLCCLFLCFPKLYTLSLSISLPPSRAVSLSSFHCLVALPVPPPPPPPPPTPSPLLLPAVFSLGRLPEALLWQDSALRAKIVH